MKIKYKFAILSAFTLVFVACLDKSSGNDSAVLSGLISLISNEQGCVGLDCSKNRTLRSNQLQSGQSLQAAFPQGYLPYIFATSSFGAVHNGNFGGISGADAFCQNNIPSSVPSTGIYKAMIVDGVNRVATTVGPNSTVGQVNWVFQPNQQYRRADDGAIVMTTNGSGMFDFSNGARLENSFALKGESGQWTGLNSNWTTWTSGGVPITCSSWNSSALTLYGLFGSSTSTDSEVLRTSTSTGGNTTSSCSSVRTAYGPYNLGLVCVEQPPPPKYIFTTSSSGVVHNGNFGGISGADAFCQSHIPSNIPSTGIYKAMLVDGVNRVATTVGPNSTVGQVNWVFQPNQQYRRAEDGANVMFTNSSGMIDFQSGKRLENSFTQVKESGQWTALNSDWTTWTSGGVPITCSSWNSSVLTLYGLFGSSTSTDSEVLKASASTGGNTTSSCSSTRTAYGPYNLGLVCVEQ
ncbi:endostatin-like outer membrane lipoprotein LenF [Leptospira kirschneri]|uniref:endostatin-like outer membrane lipoprotein LenF n=1 Tax=Leptospira kirschneri TaxID=29507 RepID=UPI003565E8E2